MSVQLLVTLISNPNIGLFFAGDSPPTRAVGRHMEQFISVQQNPDRQGGEVAPEHKRTFSPSQGTSLVLRPRDFYLNHGEHCQAIRAPANAVGQ